MNRTPAFAISSLLIFLAASQVSSAVPQVATYDGLLHAIRETRAASEARITAAVDEEKVREAWETGKLIDEHVLQHRERSDYGKRVLERLSKDLKTSQTELSLMLQFARAYPNYSAPNQLSWAHYRELLSVNDAEMRDEIASKAVSEKWSHKELRRQIKARRLALVREDPIELPEITPGPLNTYPIIRLKDRLKIDLGFGIYLDLPEKDNARFKTGDRVTLEKGKLKKAGEVQLRRRPAPTLSADAAALAQPVQVFTYSALVTQAVDGDTFHALIDLGFGLTLAQRVRLRRIDTPELVSTEGKEAKAYLEKILSRDHGRILMKSVDIDQHGRPIADVWVCTARGDKASAVGTRTMGEECKYKSIDQELLDQGLAVSISE